MSLGSTIGSFTRPEAAEFLSGFAASLNCKASSSDPQHVAESTILVGLDGCQVREKVYSAYNDSGGRNWRFILNALDHANNVLGYKAFEKSAWDVRGGWDAIAGSHNQYLVPRQDLVFEGRRFERGSRILIVQSFKYTLMEKLNLWKAAGLAEKAYWLNGDGSYGDYGET